jgi:hypothetical protein
MAHVVPEPTLAAAPRARLNRIHGSDRRCQEESRSNVTSLLTTITNTRLKTRIGVSSLRAPVLCFCLATPYYTGGSAGVHR